MLRLFLYFEVLMYYHSSSPRMDVEAVSHKRQVSCDREHLLTIHDPPHPPMIRLDQRPQKGQAGGRLVDLDRAAQPTA